MLGVSILFFVICVGGAVSLDLPDWLVRCKSSTLEKCGPEASNAVLPKILRGDAKYGIPSFQPLKLGDTAVNEAELKVSLKNCELYGIDTAFIYKTKWDEPVLTLGFTLDSLTILGEFDSGARVFDAILPRDGYSNFTLYNVKVDMEVLASIAESNNDRFVTFYRAFTKIYSRTSLHTFSGFRTGIPYLSVENSKGFTNYVLPKFESALYQAFQESAGQLLKRFSTNRLALPENY